MLEQQAHRIDVSAARRRVQTRPAVVVRIGLTCADQAWVVREQGAQRLDIALGAGIEENSGVSGLPLLDFGLERTPTGEAVIARYRQQSRCQFGVRVSLAKFLQALLGELFQILERRMLGEW